MFNVNFIKNFSINFLKEREELGYKCVLKDNAIYKDKQIIDTKINLKNHSPLGLSWGYNGSGSSQAALAILCDFTNDEKFALEHYVDFKNEIICDMPKADYVLKYSVVQHWVDVRKVMKN